MISRKWSLREKLIPFAAFLNLFLRCWIHSILWRKQNFLFTIDKVICSYCSKPFNFSDVLLSWFLIQRLSKCSYRENTSSSWSKVIRRKLIDHDNGVENLKSAFWNFEKRATGDLILSFLKGAKSFCTESWKNEISIQLADHLSFLFTNSSRFPCGLLIGLLKEAAGLRKMRRVVKVFNEAVVVWNEEKRGYGVLASSKMKGCFSWKSVCG